MTEIRKKFEATETFKLFYSWVIDFDETSNCYYTGDSYKSDCDSINAAWLMFQEIDNENY